MWKNFFIKACIILSGPITGINQLAIPAKRLSAFQIHLAPAFIAFQAAASFFFTQSQCVAISTAAVAAAAATSSQGFESMARLRALTAAAALPRRAGSPERKLLILEAATAALALTFCHKERVNPLTAMAHL